MGSEGQLRNSMMVWAQRNHVLAILYKFFGADAFDVMRLDEYIVPKRLRAFPSAHSARVATLTP